MFNRGLTNKNQKLVKSLKSTQKLKDLEGKEGVSVSATSSPVLSSKSSSVVSTPSTTTPSSPSQSKVVMSEIIEPEPKVLKSNLISNILKERHTRKRSAKNEDEAFKREDAVIHYNKKHTPIIEFKHDNILTPSWEYNETIEISSPSKKRKYKKQNKEEEMLEDISDEAYIKRHHPLELSEKYSRCGSLINTSNIDEEAINKMMEKQRKKGKLRKGYIYI